MYKTKDLAESAFLLAKGQNLTKVEKLGKTCWFVFANKQAASKIVNDYWFGNSMINAKKFYGAVQILKSMIFES